MSDPLITSCISVQPGDRVLIGLHTDDLTAEQAASHRTELEARFPDVEFTFVAGVSALAVVRAAESTP